VCGSYGPGVLNGPTGTLRSAVLPVSFSGSEVFMYKNSSGQVGTLGDSGSGCDFRGMYQIWQPIVTVTTQCFMPVSDSCKGPAISAYRSWITPLL
jgi:hypothetical protein